MFLRNALSAVLVIAACASLHSIEASDASKDLTGSEFATGVAKGTTFVKFYSPQCGHCQVLAPIWEKLAVDYQGLQQTRDFKFAEVNCLIEGDVCEDNDVTGYPSLQLFRDGRKVNVFKGARSLEELGEFVRTKAEEFAMEAEKDNGSDSTVNPFGEVVALDTQTYDNALKDGQPWLVEYYAPWCGHCKALAPVYEELAMVLKGKVNVAKVDCPANEVICRSQKVRGYPTIKLHQHGQATEYNKQRTIAPMTAFALGATESSVKRITLGGLNEVIGSPNVTFIYLNDDRTSEDITAVVEMQSQIFYEQAVIYSTGDPEIARQLSVSKVPALVVLKDERQYVFPGSLSDARAVQSWIDMVKDPLVPLITNANSAAILNAPGWLVLGLFDPSKPSTVAARKALVETAHTYKKDISSGERSLINGRPVRFAILDATKWTNYVKNALKVELLNLPVIVAVSGQDEVYYPHGSDGRRVPLEKDALLQYISDIESGSLTEQSMISYGQKTIRHVSGRIASVFRLVGNHPYVSMLLGAAMVYGVIRKIRDNGPEAHLGGIAKAD